MSAPEMKRYGAFSARDSGVPSGRDDYTTLILFHGMGWHSAGFDRLFPLVDSRNVRLVTPNRPGYPGAAPFPHEEQAQLNNIAELANSNPQLAADTHLDYIKEDTKKTYGFLEEFIAKENILVKGGIILAGWSLGAATVLELLAYAGAVPSKGVQVELRSYIKHVIIYDAPSCILGYAPPPNVYAPIFDPSLTLGEALKIFPTWLSSYYAHVEGTKGLKYEALDHPPPTIPSMDPLDVQRCFEVNPVLPGGFDDLFLRLSVQLGVFSRLRESAILLDRSDTRPRNGWDNVELKYVWCDHSTWEIPWGVSCLQADLDYAKQSGREARKVDMVRLRGGNHFCHWDHPDLALTGLLSGL